MTTPAERAEQAKVDRWLADWSAKQILAYNEHVERREEQYKKWEEQGLDEKDGFLYSDHLKEWQAAYAFSEHLRRCLPVGALLEIIQEDRDGDRRSSCKQLMEVAKTGVQLFYAAIGHIDATEEFLEEARSEWGPLVDAALEEMYECERRDPVTGEFTVHAGSFES